MLSSKAKTRPDDTGYAQTAPVGLPVPDGKKKNIGQGLHRLVVIAYRSAEDRHNMIFHSHHASHRCHNPTCFAADHVAVEPKSANEDRKECKGRVEVVFDTNGAQYRVSPTQACPHQPSYITRRVRGGQAVPDSQ